MGLVQALSPLRDLGPLTGKLGTAVAYLLQGAPDLDFDRIAAAMELLHGTASREMPSCQDPALLSAAAPHEQLVLAGIDPTRPKPKRSRR